MHNLADVADATDEHVAHATGQRMAHGTVRVPRAGAPTLAAMALQSALAAAATVGALAFAAATAERWLDRRRPHELAWTLALVCFAAGAGAAWWGASFGWTGGSFRVFYAFGAVINVPVLALGTWYLLAPPAVARLVAALTTMGVAFGSGVVFAAPMRGEVPQDTIPQGSQVFGVLPRVFAASASAIGATVLLGGAVWTIARLARHRDAAARRLAGANGLIALGTLVLSAGGLLNSVLAEMEGFAVTLVVGVALLFVGFLVTSPRMSATPAAAPSP
jgi:hypothetical protein